MYKREKLAEILTLIDKEAYLLLGEQSAKIPVVIVGGSAFMLHNLTKRPATYDIDVLYADNRIRSILKTMVAKLTFEGFLKRYCADLSGVNTVNLRKLFALANSDAARVAEPLFVLAWERGKLDYLLLISRGTALGDEYLKVASLASGYENPEDFLMSNKAPARYRAVFESFCASEDVFLANRRIVALLREKTLQALEMASVTRYRLCEDLGLNKGNVYAYLAGDESKVSKDTAHIILDYVLLKASV